MSLTGFFKCFLLKNIETGRMRAGPDGRQVGRTALAEWGSAGSGRDKACSRDWMADSRVDTGLEEGSGTSG